MMLSDFRELELRRVIDSRCTTKPRFSDRDKILMLTKSSQRLQRSRSLRS